MSMNESFANLLAQAFSDNVDALSLHLADPGTTGANDSTVPHVALTWSVAADGVTTALAQIAALVGTFTHVGLWDGATFRQGIPCRISYSAAADIALLVSHSVGDEYEIA